MHVMVMMILSEVRKYYDKVGGDQGKAVLRQNVFYNIGWVRHGAVDRITKGRK